MVAETASFAVKGTTASAEAVVAFPPSLAGREPTAAIHRISGKIARRVIIVVFLSDATLHTLCRRVEEETARQFPPLPASIISGILRTVRYRVGALHDP